MNFDFFDENALLDRLSIGVAKANEEVVFLVGAPLAAPAQLGEPGVPDVQGVIGLIRQEFGDDAGEFDRTVNEAGDGKYQAAFRYLQGRRGQQAANNIIRRAVLAARRIRPSEDQFSAPSSWQRHEDFCRLMDSDSEGWGVPCGVESLGHLIAGYPSRFGRTILTTNFDPLIEASIRQAGGIFFRTILHSDGNLTQTEADGCHVIHLHGYWHGADTLHTVSQLTQPRPRLKASLATILRDKVVVVCAYGVWDDAFTTALVEVLLDDQAFPEIVWTTFAPKPQFNERLAARLAPGIGRGRVGLYSGINCNAFFPQLLAKWRSNEAPSIASVMQRASPVNIEKLGPDFVGPEPAHPSATLLEGDVEDRPPAVEIFVGRENEVAELKSSKARVVFITGLGGQGKSTLAANYFSQSQTVPPPLFDHFVWRDCKEESERFESQLLSVIESLSFGRIGAGELSKQAIENIILVLFNLMKGRRILFVFDNADHYIDLEENKFIGSAGAFIEAFLESDHPSKVIFTCRPRIRQAHALAASFRLEGLDIEASLELFSKRGANSTFQEIRSAYDMTDGHALWLDLLAVQVSNRNPPTSLTQLLAEIRSGGGEIPTATLNSIWSSLRDREQIVLRALAETVRPETELDVADYITKQQNYSRTMKAFRTLRLLNLVVVKRRENGPDLVELHPIIRQYVRNKFEKPERLKFIDAIIRAYQKFMGSHRAELARRPLFSTLQIWTQNAELDIEAGRFDQAFVTLADVAAIFKGGAYPREFLRVVRMLFGACNWTTAQAIPGFESVFSAYIEILSYLGEYEETDSYLDNYSKAVPNKDARYIEYCDLRCFAYWVRGDFAASIEWGKNGQKLKESSNVDTKYSTRYNLALAERDGGSPDIALQTFLDGRPLADVVDPNELDEKLGHAHYGNVGRCLQMMGQVDPALVCFQKSAMLLERETGGEHIVNQGYARKWIGEALMMKGSNCLAEIFFRAAFRKWKLVAPPKADELRTFTEEFAARTRECPPTADDELESVCVDWIYGRGVDLS